MIPSSLEYPIECRGCGRFFEEEILLHGSLDGLNDNDPDSFCPFCYSDDTVAHQPKEDREQRAREIVVEQGIE